MLRRFRQSWPARITAVGFIIVLLFGNLWLADAVMGVAAPGWVLDGLFGGMALAASGGFGLAGLAIRSKFAGHVEETDEEDAVKDSDEAGPS